ncbi:hypothetical protein ACLBKT_16300 [Erythrobacter sp. W302b]|uniref:hypothetical protein n=1 Tax=Erythrobacter sp. W302b TaxID=3389874 RepID=UPI00396B0E76
MSSFSRVVEATPAFAPVGVASAALLPRSFGHDLPILGDLAQQARSLQIFEFLEVTAALLREHAVGELDSAEPRSELVADSSVSLKIPVALTSACRTFRQWESEQGG